MLAPVATGGVERVGVTWQAPSAPPTAVTGYALRYRAVGASSLLRRNLAIYGLGGVVVPFVGIKLIDLALAALGVAAARDETGALQHPQVLGNAGLADLQELSQLANQARALVSSAETVYGMLSNARSILASANPPIQPAALAGLEAALLGIESQADGFVDQATALAEPSETYP